MAKAIVCQTDFMPEEQRYDIINIFTSSISKGFCDDKREFNRIHREWNKARLE